MNIVQFCLKPHSFITISFLSVMLLWGCNQHKYSVVDLDVVEELELNLQTSEVDIIPIKCSVPMDGIYRMVENGEYTFLLGNQGDVIYCMQGDTVVSILNAKGRGYGEYIQINDFVYDERSSLLYVNADKKIMKYNVPSMSFVGSFDIDFSCDGMIVLNNEELLVNCSFWEDKEYKEVYRGLCVVSTINGEIVKRCYELGGYGDFCFLTRDMSRINGDIVVVVNDLYNSKIIKFDEKTYSFETIESFVVTPKWRVPKKIAKNLEKRHLTLKNDYYDQKVYCKGFHYPSLFDTKTICWCFPEEYEISREVAIIKCGDSLVCRSYKIPGTNIDVNPYYVKGNTFVEIVEDEAESIIDDWDELSPLGKKIYDAMKAQPFNNPVLLSFTVDKGL